MDLAVKDEKPLLLTKAKMCREILGVTVPTFQNSIDGPEFPRVILVNKDGKEKVMFERHSVEEYIKNRTTTLREKYGY